LVDICLDDYLLKNLRKKNELDYLGGGGILLSPGKRFPFLLGGPGLLPLKARLII
jgi:hypothetical protein